MQVGIARRHRASAKGTHENRVVIGKDTRLSGYMIENGAATARLHAAAGMDVFLLGPMPTPAVAMLTRSLRADLGVMISASHNPFEDNGIKLFGPGRLQGSPTRPRRAIEALDRGRPFVDRSRRLVELGRARRIDGDARPLYRIRQADHAEGLLIWPGSASSSTAPMAPPIAVAPEALWELGAEVITIGVEP